MPHTEEYQMSFRILEHYWKEIAEVKILVEPTGVPSGGRYARAELLVHLYEMYRVKLVRAGGRYRTFHFINSFAKPLFQTRRFKPLMIDDWFIDDCQIDSVNEPYNFIQRALVLYASNGSFTVRDNLT